MQLIRFLSASGLAATLSTALLCAADDAKKPTMTYLVDLSTNSTAKDDPQAGVFVSIDDPQAAEMAQFGSSLIERIGTMLVNEINRELATREITDSIEVMHLKNLALPKPAPGKPKVTAIKRTSSMLRDPLNAPDAADRAALDKIHRQLMNNEAPDKIIVQKIAHPGEADEWRVYRPIATTQSCLACHGDPEKFKPEVRELLERLYPGDKAVDYRRQEYRGVLRVSLLAPEAAKP